MLLPLAEGRELSVLLLGWFELGGDVVWGIGRAGPYVPPA